LLLVGAIAARYMILCFGTGWRMKTLQLTIFLAILFTGTSWDRSPAAAYIAVFVAAGAVFAHTVLPVYAIDWYRNWKAESPLFHLGNVFVDGVQLISRGRVG
jgi:hypothetical protein